MKGRFSEGWRVREGLCSFRMMGDTPLPQTRRPCRARAQRTPTEEFYEVIPSSTVNSVPGTASTTPSALTRLSATLLLNSSCPVPIPFERSPCVTNLLDEYKGFPFHGGFGYTVVL